MVAYICFLRGVNVSGKRKLPMAILKKILLDIGLLDVQTYIQSGNVVFRTHEKSRQIIEDRIGKAIDKTFGFDVPVLIKTVSEIEQILLKNPYKEPKYLDANQVYFVLFQQNPSQEKKEALLTEAFANEEFQIQDDCLFLLCKKGYGNAKLNNNLVERKLKVEATTRNYKTMKKMVAMAMDL